MIKSVPLSEIANINPRVECDWASDEPCSFVPMEAVDDVTASIAKLTTRPYGEVAKGYTAFAENDVIVAKITPCMENGKCAIARNLRNRVGFGSTEFHVLRASDRVLPQWLFYFWRWPPTRSVAARSMTGTAGQRRVPSSVLESLPLPLPSLSEQRRIAGVLEQTDRLCRTRRYALQLSDTFLPAAFLEIFGEPRNNDKKWDEILWGDLIDVCSGSAFKLREYSQTGVRLLQIANVTFGEIDWSTTAFLPQQYLSEYPKLQLRPGDLVMALNRPIIGTRVKFAVLRENDCPAILYQRVGKFTLKVESMIQPFLCGFMRTDFFCHELKKRLAGSDQPYINPGELQSLRVPIPPLTLQQRFAAMVAQHERLQAGQREALRQAEHLFQSLLHRAFTNGLQNPC